jgi:cytoskeletal protein CcmA (bactofilin family)
MTRLGRSLVIIGDLTSDEPIAIDCTVTGPVVVRGATLTVAADATIEGDVRCGRAEVHGTVVGSIAAGERIELFATADVLGDLSANQVIIADGAQFGGRIDMGQRTIAARVARFKAEQTGQESRG